MSPKIELLISLILFMINIFLWIKFDYSLNAFCSGFLVPIILYDIKNL